MRIGFLGGTGPEGKGLALRFAAAGVEVVLGSRSEERARITAESYNKILGGAMVRGQENRVMLAACEIVFLTTPFDQAVPAVQSYYSDLRPGLILVDVTVPVKFRAGSAEYLEQPAGSNAEEIATHLPKEVALVGAFKTIPAHVLAEFETPLHCDVFVCGDSVEARERIMDQARLIPTLRPLDAGPLRMARIIERMTVLAIHLNRRYKKTGARYGVQGL